MDILTISLLTLASMLVFGVMWLPIFLVFLLVGVVLEAIGRFL